MNKCAILTLTLDLLALIMARKLVLGPAIFKFPGCSGRARALLCFLILNTFLVAVEGDFRHCSTGKIEPKSPYIWLDEEFQITCTAGKDLNGSLQFDILHDHHFEQWKEELIGNNSIKLVGKLKPNATRNKFSLKCVELTADGTRKCLDNVYVDFEYRPVPPRHLQLRIYDWETMMLTWDLGQTYINDNHVNVSCQFKAMAIFRGNGASAYANCPLLNNTACYWNASLYTDADFYDILVLVVNIKTNDTANETQTFDRDLYVEPAPLLWERVNETQPGCVYLQWKGPLRSGLDFLYHLSYTSDCGEAEDKFIPVIYEGRLIRKINKTVCNLTANANYTFSVQASVYKNRTSVGYWSMPVVKSIRMAEQVPTLVPPWTEGLYKHVKDGITLYYEPLPKCDLHSNSAQYVVKDGFDVIAAAPATDFSMFVPLAHINSTSVLYLHTKNNQGISPSSTNVTVAPKDTYPYPSSLLVEYVPSKTNSCRQIYFTIGRNPRNEQHFINITHNLVYCIGIGFCKEQLYWVDIDDNSSMEDCNGYHFGLITRAYSRSKMVDIATEIQWNICVYEHGKVPQLSPSSLTAEETSGSLKIEFNNNKKPGCQPVYVSIYEVRYCTVEETCVCTSKEEIKTIPGDEHSRILNELPTGQLCVWIKGINSAGRGKSVALGPYTITSSENYSWVVPTSIAAAVIFTSLVLFIIVKIVYPKLKSLKELPVIKDLLSTHEPQLSPLEDISVDTASEGEHHYVQLPVTDFDKEVSPCNTDSGHSSLNTEGSQEKIRQQTTDVDSAIGSTHIYSQINSHDTSKYGSDQMGSGLRVDHSSGAVGERVSDGSSGSFLSGYGTAANICVDNGDVSEGEEEEEGEESTIDVACESDYLLQDVDSVGLSEKLSNVGICNDSMSGSFTSRHSDLCMTENKTGDFLEMCAVASELDNLVSTNEDNLCATNPGTGAEKTQTMDTEKESLIPEKDSLLHSTDDDHHGIEKSFSLNDVQLSDEIGSGTLLHEEHVPVQDDLSDSLSHYDSAGEIDIEHFTTNVPESIAEGDSSADNSETSSESDLRDQFPNYSCAIHPHTKSETKSNDSLVDLGEVTKLEMDVSPLTNLNINF